MGFWSDLGSIFEPVADFFGGNGGGVAGAIAGGVATLGGALISSSANERAAEKSAAAAKAQADAITAGNQAAQQRFETVQAQTQPGLDHLRGVVTNSQGLTPEQQRELEDVRRRSLDTISRSGLRGSGRAVTAALRGVEEGYVGRAIESNRSRADAAAGRLANPYFDAAGNMANLDASTGRAQGSAAMSAGLDDAAAGLATGSVRGQALGDIASLIASDRKGREGRYAKRVEQMDRDMKTRNEERV